MNSTLFDRQMRLPEIGKSGQKKIVNARVLVVGAGGLGSPALIYLLTAGVGSLGVADHDLVSESNLHRQILFKECDVGKNKAKIASQRLKEFRSDSNIVFYEKKLNPQNADAIMLNFDVILDCTDNFESKFTIADACYRLRKIHVVASMFRFEAQLAAFNSKKAACFRCLYSEAPTVAIPDCAIGGVLGPFAGMVGSMQALLAIQCIVGSPKWIPQYCTLHVLDGKTFQNRKFKITKNLKCGTCSAQKQMRIPQRVSEIQVEELKEALKNSNVQLIDVREPAEQRRGLLPGAKKFPLSKIEQGFFPKVPKNTERIILYCAVGMRSKKACALLKPHFKNLELQSLQGGMSAVMPAERVTL